VQRTGVTLQTRAVLHADALILKSFIIASPQQSAYSITNYSASKKAALENTPELPLYRLHVHAT
jgi:hypothetical protein